MTRARRTVSEAVRKGLAKRGTANKRADAVYYLLLADGPMTSKEIVERLNAQTYHVMGSGQAMELLQAEGRVFRVRGPGQAFMYYAAEEGEEVPCTCVGLSHKDTCPNWRLPE